jgi:hypothetical protein
MVQWQEDSIPFSDKTKENIQNFLAL